MRIFDLDSGVGGSFRSVQLGYGILAYALTGVIVTLFGLISYSDSATRSALLYALSLNLYFALALTVLLPLVRNYGLALIITVAPLGLSLLLRLPLLLHLLFFGYLYLLLKNRTPKVSRIGVVRFFRVVAIAALYSIVVLGTSGSMDIFFNTQIASGEFKTDPFFHAAIAAMIEHFDKVSVGLHGFVPLKYHTLSHYLYAAFAYAAGLPLIASYSSSYSIVFAPLLLLSIVGAAEDIAPSRSVSEQLLRMLFIFLIFAGFVGYGSESLSYQYGLWNSFFVSESYTLSLILLFGLISLMAISKLELQACMASILLVFISMAKLSTGVIACAIYIAHLFFCCRQQFRTRILSALFSLTGVGLVLWGHATGSSGNVSIDYLNFLKTYVEQPDRDIFAKGVVTKLAFWWAFAKFGLVHFFFSWICFVLLFNASYSHSERRVNWLHVCIYNLVALGIGGAVLALLSVPGGSAYYFSNVAMFVSLPYITVFLSAAFCDWSSQTWACRTKVILPATVCLAGLVGVYIYGTCFVGNALDKRTSAGLISSRKPWADYVQQLESIRETPGTDRLLVYVAKENDGFWSAKANAACFAQSFAIVALSERAAIFGLPDKANCKAKDYGFQYYSEQLFALSARHRIPHEELLLESKRLGFDGYIDVTRTGWKPYYLAAEAHSPTPKP